jgi:hypothetical protein
MSSFKDVAGWLNVPLPHVTFVIECSKRIVINGCEKNFFESFIGFFMSLSVDLFFLHLI